MSIGAAIGGVITKILSHRQRNFELKYDEAQAIRKELRLDINHMETKLEKVSLDLDQWKDRYYKLADENIQLRSRCRSLEIEVEELKISLYQTNPEPLSHVKDPGTQKQ